MTNHRTLPDGTTTSSDAHYIQAWTELCAPVAALLGWYMIGWSAATAQFSTSLDGERSVTLSVEELQKLNDVIKKANATPT